MALLSGRLSAHSARFWLFSLKIWRCTYKPSNYVLGLIFVVNIKFPLATYHTIVPSTEELYYLNDNRVSDVYTEASTEAKQIN